MKSASVGLAAHLASGSASLARCLRLERLDGQRFGFTSHDRDLVFGGVTYRASPGMRTSAIAGKADMSVQNSEADLLLDDDAITQEDLRAGLWDFAAYRVFFVNWADLAQGDIRRTRGRLGEVVLDDTGLARTELRGLTQAMQQTIGELTSAECREDLGGPRCKIPLRPALIARGTVYALGQFVRVATQPTFAGSDAEEGRIYECTTEGTTAATAPTFSTTPGNITVDGSVTWTARPAWTYALTVESAPDAETVIVEDYAGVGDFADGWFDGGVMTVETGLNAGISREVVGWVQSTREMQLFLPLRYPLLPGDILRASPGCDKRLATCHGKFANRLNFRGEPFLTGADAMIGTAP